MKHSHFLSFPTSNLIGSRSVVETTVTIRSLFRKSFLFLTLMLLPIASWGATTYTCSASDYNHANFIVKESTQSKSATIVDWSGSKMISLASNKTTVNYADTSFFARYDNKTNETQYVVYFYNSYNNNTPQIAYVTVVKSDGSATTRQKSIVKNTGDTMMVNAFERVSIYAHVGRTTTYIAQIKVIESGSTTFPIGGAIGYSTTFNKPRVMVAKEKIGRLDGIYYCPSGDVKPANSTALKIKTFGTHYIKFTLPVKTQVEVTTTNNIKFTFGSAKNVEGSTQYGGSAAVHKAVLNAGTYFLNPISGNSTDMQITNLAFATPAASHKVTYNAGAGSGTVPTQEDVCEETNFTVASGSDMTPPEGKEFKCWNDGSKDYKPGDSYKMGTSDVTLTAQWQTKPVLRYNLTFSGTTITTSSIEKSSTLITNPTNLDATSHAKVDESASNGNSGKIRTLAAMNTDSCLILTFDVAENYSFTPDSFSIKAVAVSTSKDLTVVFADATNSVSVTKTGLSTSSTATKYTLAFSSKKALEGTVTVKMYCYGATNKWRINTPIEIFGTIGAAADKYTVSFAKGDEGASGSMDPVEVAEGTEYIVPACGFTAPSNKEFDKWTSTDVTISGGKFTMPSSNVTLTATWKDAGKVTVTYDANGASSGSAPVDETQYTIGTSVTVLGNTGDLAKTGYAFACWNTQANGLGTDYVAGNTFDIAANTTLYAKWNEVGSSTWGYLGAGTAGTNTYTTKAMFPGVDATSTINDVELTSDPGWDTFYQTLATDLVNTTATEIQYICLHTNGLAANLNVINSKVLVSVSVAYTKLDANANLYLQFANGSGNIGDEIAVTGNTSSQLQKIETFAAPAGATKAKLYRKTGTANNWNTGITYIKAIAASEYDIATTTAEHGTFAVQLGGTDVTKAPEGATVALVATPDAGYDIQAWDVYKTGETATKVTVTDHQFTMPAYNVTVAATFQKVISTDATLKDLKVDGTTVTGFSPATYSYAVQLPYKTTTVPTVTATKNNQFASEPVITPAASLPGATTVQVTAEDGTTSLTYTINFTVAPKDGVCIVKTATTGSKNQTLSGLYADMEATNMVNISDDKKLGGSGNYIGVQMVSAQKFKEGDSINVHTTTAGGQGNIAIYSNTGKTATKIADLSSGFGVKGDNKFALPKSAESYSTLYICRTNANSWNGYVDFVEVTRPMNPVLTALTVAGENADIDEANKTISVELPHGTVAATAELVPTIVANGGTPTAALDGTLTYDTPINYIITDKDGDQTTYALTATEAVLKHTVTFDTKGGTTIDSREIVDDQKLGTVTSPEKWDNTFAGWNKQGSTDIIAKIEDEVITADVTYEANWTPETGVIKLIDGGKINRPAFITGATLQNGTVEYKGVEMPYAKLSGTASSISNVNDTNKLIIYNPTTTQTKIKVVAHSTSSSERNVYISYLLEGGTTAPTPAEYSLTSANPFLETDYIEFNSTEHRSIYIHVPGSVGDVQFLQIKVIESGEPLVKAGEDGYSLNMNKGRMPMPSGQSVGRYFDGVTFTNIGSGYAILYSPYITLKSGNCSFKVENDITLSVTTTGASNKYYVTKDAPGTDNETTPTADVANTFDLTAGTWYISTAGSNVYLTNISFSKPNAPKPEITALSNGTYCQGEALPELSVTATVTSGTMSYQWYKGTTPVGTNAATYTPAEDGTYHVVITNTKENYNASQTTSSDIVVASVAGTEITSSAGARDKEGEAVTVSVTATGKNLTYAWYASDAAGTISGEVLGTAAELNVIVAAADSYYKVLVNGDCGTEQSAVVKVETWTVVTPVTISGHTVWNLNTSDCADAQIKLDNSTTPKKNEEYLLANIYGVKNTNTFPSAALYFSGEYIYRDATNKPTCGNYFKFTTTVPGLVTVTFSSNGGNRHIDINGVESANSTGSDDTKTFSAMVNAGEVMMKGENAGENDTTYLRFFKIEFTPSVVVRSGLTAGKIVTYCNSKNVIAHDGATFYYISGKAEDLSSINLTEVTGELVAGYPYIVVAEKSEIRVVYGDQVQETAQTYNGLHGVLGETVTLEDGDYLISQNKYYRAHTGNNNTIVSGRAFLRLSEIETVNLAPGEETPAPAPRRFTMGGEGRGTATDLDMIGETKLGEPQKFIIHNQVVILRNGQLYNTQGALLK